MHEQGNGGRRIGRCRYTGVKTFTATMAHEREALGERVTAWIRSNPGSEIIDTVVTQSSDDAFHCLAITVFFRPREAGA